MLDSAGKPKPLFRQVDWLTFGITTVVVLIGYLYTLAPDVTLQDSGELAVASMYAGVPHPPGYPVWTIYTWFFTKLLPFSNIAWRVGVSSAVAGALACGLIGLMVSRGSSMILEGISEFRQIPRRWEDALCVASGFCAGMLMGYNGFMWSQAVIVEVYTLSVLSLTGVLVCLLRWIHAPQQNRYLYLAFFWFGICFNNHQSLLVTALGMVITIAVVKPRLGRDLLFWVVLVWIAGLIGRKLDMVTTLKDNDPLLYIYNFVGLSALAGWIYLLIKCKKDWWEAARDLAMVAALGYVGVLLLHITHYITSFYQFGDLERLKVFPFIVFNLFGLAAVGGFVILAMMTWTRPREWLHSIICGVAWFIGAAFYLYMPIASMTNPPLNWGYPRTVTGFFHAFTRGQYERIHPTFGQSTFIDDMGRFIGQVIMYTRGVFEEFNLVYVLIGVIPLLFLKRMQKRERNWMICLVSIYFFLSVFLLVLLNPAPDRQSQELNKVFFTASHVMIAMLIGYGLTLITALVVTQYDRVWPHLVGGGLAAVGIALVAAVFEYINVDNPLVHYNALYGVLLAVAGAVLLVLPSVLRDQPQWLRETPHGPAWLSSVVPGLLAVFVLMPVYTIVSHWEDNEQRGHLFGYWFGHDMFTPPFKDSDGKPLYPEMARDAILFGGTDPGRFNPTYMIFCESFIAPKHKPRDPNFDRRDVYLITQNALADGTYLEYIRAHYNRSAQIDPPFFQELFRGPREIELNRFTNIIARMMIPIDRFFMNLGDRIEKKRRVGSSYFKPDHFTDLPALVARLKSPNDSVSRYLRSQLSERTLKLLDTTDREKQLRRALAEDLNAVLEKGLFDPKQLKTKREEKQVVNLRVDALRRRLAVAKPEERADLQSQLSTAQQQLAQVEQAITNILANIADIQLTPRLQRFLQENPQGHTRIRLTRLLLEAAFPKAIAKSKGGVYPDMEIYTPSNEDSQRCFQEYLADAQRRLKHDQEHPNEPRQIKPGEDVRIIDNKVQVSGQVAVMAINALLAKVIFDHNPDHEFYIEESFPLDWMYPHLTPYGIIMKLNREPVPEITQDMVRRDHEFWCQFSDRLIGNWITYDTSISNICAFAEKVYLRRDYSDFKGDPKFIRDDDAQKAFSKLRSSIAGIYNWRITHTRNLAEQQRVLKEAEFAFKQAFAFCPYSPEAVFRFVNLLVSMNRIDESLLIAQTAQKLDPFNQQLDDLVRQLSDIQRMRAQGGRPAQPGTPQPATAPNAQQRQAQLRSQAVALEGQLAKQPTNIQLALQLVSLYTQLHETNRALLFADQLIANPQADVNTLLLAANACQRLGQYPRVERALQRLVQLMPDNPEGWFDLAGFQAILGKGDQALASLRKALELNQQRMARGAPGNNLHQLATNDPRFAGLRQSTQFQKLIQDTRP